MHLNLLDIVFETIKEESEFYIPFELINCNFESSTITEPRSCVSIIRAYATIWPQNAVQIGFHCNGTMVCHMHTAKNWNSNFNIIIFHILIYLLLSLLYECKCNNNNISNAYFSD